MAMVVKNNMSAVRTLSTLNKNNSALQDSLSKVSSGLKINTAKDDASGYAISERMRVQIRSLDQATQNSQNASSLMKNAEGAVERTIEILRTLKQKAIDAATDTNTEDDRATIQKEIDQFIDQIDDNALVTFNGKYLLEGSRAQSGDAVATHMTNSNLSTDTNLNTQLINLSNRNGENLEINTGDRVTVSFVMGGKTYTSVLTSVKNTTRLGDIYEMLNVAKNGTTEAGSAFADIINEKHGVALQSGTVTLGFSGTGLMKSFPTGTVLHSVGHNVSFSTQTYVYSAHKDSDGNIVKGEYDTYTILLDVRKEVIATSNTAVLNTGTATVPGDYKVLKDVSGKGSATYLQTCTYTTSLSGLIFDGTTYNFDSEDNVSFMFGDKALDFSKAIGAKTSFMTVESTTLASGSTIENTLNGLTDTAAFKTFAASSQTGVSSGAKFGTISGTGSDTFKAIAKSGTSIDFSAVLSSFDANGNVMTDTTIGTMASGKIDNTNDGFNALTFMAANTGLEGQISGLSISVADSEGNVKKATNTALDAFSTTIYAANKTADGSVSFQVGAAANQAIKVGLMDMRSEALGLKGRDGTTIQVTTRAAANAAVAAFDNAINKALDQQTTIGAISARLDYTASNLTTSSENVQAAESTIRDADMAKEMTDYTKNNVLLQAAQSMLAQANQNSSAVLSLLQ